MSRPYQNSEGPSRTSAAGRKAVLIALAGGLLLAGGLASCRKNPRTLETVQVKPRGIMGTDWELVVVLPAGRTDGAQDVVDSATDALRDIEAMMSDRLSSSALSRFNAAPAGEAVALPAELRGLIQRSVAIAEQTDGAFDVTVMPLVHLWRQAGKTGKLPTDEQIAEARRRIGTGHLRPTDQGIAKDADGVEVDLGGIAKGYGVDRAVEPLRAVPGVAGGMVNAGGNLRCFGVNPKGGLWRVGIQHPFKPRETLCGAIALTDAAVSTSGDYERSSTIAGKRYNHILDPRTGWPVEDVHSVTVVSLGAADRPPSATDADAWSTALTVLGPDGLKRLADRPGMEAMMISGTPEAPVIRMTDGFAELLDGPIKLE